MSKSQRSFRFVTIITLFAVISTAALSIAIAGVGAQRSASKDSIASETPDKSPNGTEAPTAASDALPILYYDFENNATRTTFENLVEQAVNTGSGAISVTTPAAATVAGVAGAGRFRNNDNTANNGEGLSTSASPNWASSVTTDPGTGATAYYQFVVNTSGFSGISLDCDTRASSTGPARVGVLYSTDGSTFTSLGALQNVGFSATAPTDVTSWTTNVFDLSGVAAVNNQSSVTIRIYAFAGTAGERSANNTMGTAGTAGTLRIDNISVRANTITASKTLLNYPAIGLSLKSGNAFTPTYGAFTVNGSGINATLASALQFGGVLTLTSGNIVTGANVLTVTAAGSVAGASASSYVNGNLQKTVTIAASAGSQIFEVGDATLYAPINFSTTTGALNIVLTGSTTAGDHPNIATSGLNAAKTANRFWTLTTNNPGSFANANLTFNFNNPADLDGAATPANFVVKKFDAPSTWAGTTTGTVTSTSTQATGVSGFSDFAVGEVQPAAADVSLSGRVMTADGRGIRNAYVTVSGGDLPQPVTIQTGSFGWYRFENLSSGETYLVTVGAKRYRFSNPTQFISLSDNLEGVDFVANP